MRYTGLLLLGLLWTLNAYAQTAYTLSGKVLDARKKAPVEFAAVVLGDNKQWTMTNEKGEFILKDVAKGETTLRITSLGFVEVTRHLTVEKSLSGIEIVLQEKNLALSEVVVTAQSKTSDLTTSYTLDRATLDHAQLLNVSEITSLLPGGKTKSQSLVSESIVYLQEQSTENGNPSFGTAIEVDGVRLSNNAAYRSDGYSATRGIDTRNVSSVNIESVEVISGIPSVEYGDLSSGIVNITTRKGKTPYIIEMSTKPHTKQIAASKGFSLGEKIGMLNASLDHAKSVSKIYSPYTSYDRNTVSLNYSNVFNKASNHPLSLSVGFTGNVGGYNTEADPDQFKDSFTEQKDNTLRANFQLRYLANKSWITNIELSGSVVSSNKQTKEKKYKDSSSASVAIHALEEGYFMAVRYEDDPSAPIVLTKPGYWAEVSFHDSKPVDYALKLKADWLRKFDSFNSKFLLGVDFNRSGNNGWGSYYEDMSVAPTWRAYRFDEDPFVNNWAVYAEERLSYALNTRSNLELMAGVRSDITHIAESEYGTVSNLSPRFNLKYSLRQGSDDFLRSFSAHAGWGKAVKLPSAEVLYPRTSYSDLRVFLAASTLENYSYAAYYTRPYQAIYNPDLEWQYTIQQELGIQTNLKGTKVSLSAYRKKTHNPYMAVANYTPFTYKESDASVLVEGFPIASADREYTIDRNTGVISVIDKTGTHETIDLPYKEVNTYKSQTTYTNGNPVERHGLDWIIDFAPIRSINTSFRIDGNYYYYKGLEETLIASRPSNTMNDGTSPYQYIGYYVGTSSVSTGSNASASGHGNGSISKQLNTNFTVTTHIPKVRLIVSLKVEATFYQYNKRLSEYSDGTKIGYALADKADWFSTDTDIYGNDKYVIIYPLYYSTWENPDERIPFMEQFLWAYENDSNLFGELSKMVQKSNYGYIFNPSRISTYYSANISVTKEIGDIASVSFYANNFLNSLKEVKDSRTGNKTSLYTSYIPSFYYGLSLRLKL